MPPTASHPTAEALLAAGFILAESKGLGAMTIDDVVAEAGVAKGTFYTHFPDRGVYLATLHRKFHDDLAARVRAAIEGREPGAERLWLGAEAYLDGCLGKPALKALLLEARGEPLVSQAVADRNRRFAELAAIEFRAMSWPDPLAAARLFVGMAAEAALAELEIGASDPATRASLRRFIRPGA